MNTSELIFRQITPADFFNINKKPGAEEKGGGQSYIDVPTKNVSIDTWHKFFPQIRPRASKSGPVWTVEVNSLGGLGSQTVEIGQRREASVNIRAQKLYSGKSNRIFAWHPSYGGFPRAPAEMSSAEDPEVIELSAGVRIFIMNSEERSYWAGWLRTDYIERLAATDIRFEDMLVRPAGHLQFTPSMEFNENSLQDPFDILRKEVVEGDVVPTTEQTHSTKNVPYNAKTGRTEEAIAADFFQDDTSSEGVKKTQRVVEVFERNRKAARYLKELYKQCQITGDKFVFPKINGDPYLEIHHLIPLGEGGSDEPANLVVVSAHIHRMLHYAIVEGIDLSKIVDGKLNFTINGDSYTIEWLPEHARVIAEAGGTIA